MRFVVSIAILAAAALIPAQVVGTKGMVVSDEQAASTVGAKILRSGGNAVDAAIATGFALSVVHPQAGNIGGGGFMLVRLASGKSLFLDYREAAPELASRNMYLDEQGAPIPNASLLGLRSAGVPGSVAGLWEAHVRFGRLPWRFLVQPAIDLAEKGFMVSPSLAEDLRHDYYKLAAFPETKRVYLRSGESYLAGDKMILTDLGHTLERIRDHGAKGFYEGETANLIDADMRDRGGLIRLSDLSSYRAKPRKPLRGNYGGFDIWTAPPPSSGGAVLLEMLNVLKQLPPTSDLVLRTHEQIEAMKLAFADRTEYFGDPDFIRVPTTQLLSKDYAIAQSKRISMDRATPSSEIKPGLTQPTELPHTTHYSVVDQSGNAVSCTTTLNFYFGSGDTIAGTGVLLNDEMDDFASKPGTANGFGLIQGEANSILPHKRPLSSMTPTIAVKNGKILLVLGSPGGPTIINTVLEVFLNVADRHDYIQLAVDRPRFHHQWLPDQVEYEFGLLKPQELTKLKAMGDSLRMVGSQGIANCIEVDLTNHKTYGAPDHRYKAATAASQ